MSRRGRRTAEAEGVGPRGRDGRLRARVARPGRELPAGDAAAARCDGRGLRPAGVPGVSRGGGVVDLGGHIEDLLAVMEEVRTGSGPGLGRARSCASGTAWGATW